MNEFMTIQAAINKAFKAGVYDLNESVEVLKALLAVNQIVVNAAEPEKK